MSSRIRLSVGLVALLAVAGCNGETTVTGTIGERQITGKVVPVGDLAGARPDGIDVRARGLGVTSTTDMSGAFVLTGLPEDEVELTFSRSSDGVEAGLQVGADVRSLTVDLESKRASVRRRGVRSPRIQLEGLVTEITGASITVMDASRHAEVTCAIVESTLLRKGNRALTVMDIIAGDRVHITATPNAGGAYDAVEIKLQEADEPGEDEDPWKRELEGIVIAIDASSITVSDASTGEQTAAITGDTVIRMGGTPLTVTDIDPGDRVHVKARIEDDGSLTAFEIMLQNPS
jgi:hypothetical protein